MNEYIKLIIDNLDVSYICSVMLLGYMITKSKLITKIKLQKRWIILIIGVIVAVIYYFFIKIDLDVLFFSFVTAQFLNLYVAEYVIDFFIKKIKKLTEKS